CFFSDCYGDLRALHSFPTRRSSDLMLIHSLRIKNLLSFGPDTESLPLAPLNVLIGPNGSGKSNFLEAISLLQAAPKDLSAPLKRSEEHTSELQSRFDLVCRLLLEKK